MSVHPIGAPQQEPVVWQPATAEEAMALKHRLGEQAVMVAGGTWLRVRWENGLQSMSPHLISLGRIAVMNGYSIDSSGTVSIGAAVTLADLQEHSYMRKEHPLLVKACREIAAPSVRNLATIGGNVMTRTGDLIPALLVLDASVRMMQEGGERTMGLAEWLAAGMQEAAGLLLAVEVPARTGGGSTPIQTESSLHEFYVKVGRREAFTPSVVTVAGRLVIQGSERRIAAAALSAGGGAMVPARFAELEKKLLDRVVTKQLLRELHAEAASFFQPLADDYASAQYRKQAAANLLVAEIYQAWRKGGGTDAGES